MLILNTFSIYHKSDLIKVAINNKVIHNILKKLYKGN